MTGFDDEERATVSLVLSGAEEPAAPSWKIEVVGGPDRGLVLERAAGTVVAGTYAGADLQLSDDSVSRRHAELHLLANGVLVVDLGSRNGTRVGRSKIERALVGPGGTVRLGRTELRITIAQRAAQSTGPERFGDFITRAPALQRMLAQLERAARTSTTILIEGETGTGKDVLARAIHASSPRAKAPFTVVDCSAMVEGLLESQLFGHKRGAFTGAVDDQVGAFAAADGGTLFLDELGELPATLQPKLLRALEARAAKPIGGNEERPFDVRIVAATNRDLEAMARAGSFRTDLYYRVAVLRARIPPLRERREDVIALAEHYLGTMTKGAVELAPETRDVLGAYDWPGNARELRNVLESAIAVGSGGPTLYPEDLFALRADEAREGEPQTFHEAKERIISDFERRYVRQLLERNGGNVTRAAKEAGISRNALQALMKRVDYGDA